MLPFLLNSSHFNKFTWRSSVRPISSSHGGLVSGPSPVRMEVQCRAHLQFTWRPSAGPISSSHGGPVQGPSPVRMEVQCRAHLQFTWRSSAGPISSIRCKAHSTAGGCQPELYHRGTRLEGRGQHTSCLHPGWTLIYAGPMQTARA